MAIVPQSAATIRLGEVEDRSIAGQIPPLRLVAVWRSDEQAPVVARFVDEWGTG